MFCGKCGANLPENSIFCTNCGFKTTPDTTAVPSDSLSIQTAMMKKKSNTGLRFALYALSILAAVSILFALIKILPANGGTKESAELSPSGLKSGLFLQGSAQTVTGPQPITPAPSSSLAPSPSFEPAYIDELIAYFDEIALKSEYGDTTDNGIVRRWEKPLRVEIKGDYTEEDYAMLAGHIDTLNALYCLPEIKAVRSGGNYIVHFVPLDELPKVIPGYVEDNWGYVTLYWNDTCEISNAVMGVATDITSQIQRNHLILEEFTQGLGLLNDSPKYQDSIFQIEWTEIQSLSEMDLEIIKMLYSPAVRAGMPRTEAEDGLRRLLENG